VVEPMHHRICCEKKERSVSRHTPLARHSGIYFTFQPRLTAPSCSRQSLWSQAGKQ
jgi:hypothetical protein